MPSGQETSLLYLTGLNAGAHCRDDNQQKQRNRAQRPLRGQAQRHGVQRGQRDPSRVTDRLYALPPNVPSPTPYSMNVMPQASLCLSPLLPLSLAGRIGANRLHVG